MNTESSNILSNISEHLDKAKDISRQLDEMLLAVDNIEKYIHKLAEQIINLLSITDTPVGRFKLGIDTNKTDEESNIQTLAIKEAKKTLLDMEMKELLSANFISRYSHFWRM